MINSNNLKNKPQSGFTLIELMIVVAIIGILAAIATTQYQRFIARAQVSEAANLLGGAKTVVEFEAAQNDSFPATASLADVGIKTSGMYIESITSNDTDKTLTAIFRSDNTSALLHGKTLVFQRDPDGAWTCKVTPSTIPSNLLPKVCE